MSVQGGGGGGKIPPGPATKGGRGAEPTERQPARAAEGSGPVAARAPDRAEPSGPQSPKTDAFEGTHAAHTPGRAADGPRLEEAFAHATAGAGIENLVRLLEAARSELLTEHAQLREQAAHVLETLVKAGFHEAQLGAARAELQQLRTKMAALRRRLHRLQRRLKSAFAGAGRSVDANLAHKLAQKLERLLTIEPGLRRSLLALQIVEQAYAGPQEAPPLQRLHLGEGGRDGLGSEIAQLTAGAVIAEAARGMLQDAPFEREDAEADTPPPANASDEAATALKGMRLARRAIIGRGPKRGDPDP